MENGANDMKDEKEEPVFKEAPLGLPGEPEEVKALVKERAEKLLPRILEILKGKKKDK